MLVISLEIARCHIYYMMRNKTQTAMFLEEMLTFAHASAAMFMSPAKRKPNRTGPSSSVGERI